VNVSQQLSDPILVFDYYIVGRSPTFQVQLLPGYHQMYSYGAGGQVSFTVDARGNISYDPSLQGVLVSPGPGQLTVNGVTVNVSQQLSDPYVVVDSYTVEYSAPTFQLHLLPGTHQMYSYGSGGQVSFAVDARGNISYDPSLQGILVSPGPGQLTVNGATVSVDARALSDSSVVVDSYTVEQTAAAFQLVFLPGTHTIRSRDGSKAVTFTVDASDNIDYPQSEDLELGGRGTKALIVKSLG
jgi:hypothetical protein